MDSGGKIKEAPLLIVIEVSADIRKVEKYLYVTYLSLFVRKGEKK